MHLWGEQKGRHEKEKRLKLFEDRKEHGLQLKGGNGGERVRSRKKNELMRRWERCLKLAAKWEKGMTRMGRGNPVKTRERREDDRHIRRGERNNVEGSFSSTKRI